MQHLEVYIPNMELAVIGGTIYWMAQVPDLTYDMFIGGVDSNFGNFIF